ncbi:MAG: glycosyltransferase family 2 protein [Caulobacter sp.]|nr:glycosyltransferase family 2 protein [Caulobacter sp.]
MTSPAQSQAPANTGKVPVSCCIRTQNEAARIGEVIAAALRVTDDVVIVDSGSTDDTVAIAEGLGARVFHQPWLGNGGQKRAAEDRALHPWILDLDADEVLTDELIAEIRGLFAKGEPPHSVYELTFITAPPVGEPWYNLRHIMRNKFYDMRVVRAPDHRAWDQFEVPKGVTVGKLKGYVLHYSFRDFAHFSEKMNRSSSSRARESKLKPMWSVALRVIAGPPFYFLKHYLMRGLWKAGLYGFVISGISSHARWQRDIKMYEIHLRARDAGKVRNAG